MPIFEVQETIGVDAAPDRVIQAIRKLDQWPEWFPWLMLDPDVDFEVDDTAQGLRWEGRLVGSGLLRVSSTDTVGDMAFELHFEKPWRSSAVSVFEIKPQPPGVEVTWRITGRLPLHLFWRRSGMRVWVGLDCRRGLGMLKDWVERGRVPSRLEFPGVHSFQGWHYVGVRSACGFDEFGRVMCEAMSRLESWLREADVDPSGPPFSILHRKDLRRRQRVFTLGMPLSRLATDLPPDLEAGFLPRCDVYTVRHIGAYRHVGNAWAAAMLRQRRHIFRHNRVVPPFEIYEVPPGSAAEANLVTTINYPLV